MLKLLAGNVEIPHIHQHQVIVRSAGDQPEALLDEFFRQNGGVLHDLLSIGLKLGLEGLAKAHGLCCNDVLQRTALRAGEDGRS